MAMNTWNVVFWVMTLCGLAHCYQFLEEDTSSIFWVEVIMKANYVPPKQW